MKKTSLFLFIILLVLSIGTVNATNETDLSTLNVTNDVENDNIVLFNENIPKSMMELQYMIYNSTDELILDCDYEFSREDMQYDWGGKYIVQDGVKIDKDIVIDGRGHTINGHLKIRLLQVSETANVVLKNIYFMNGKACNTLDDMGGAVLNKGTKCISINNCTFDNNKAIIGGAVNNAHIVNCKFIDNNADYGGAVYSSTDTVQILYSKFINNTANDGGAIHASNNVRVKNSIFENNKAEGHLILQSKGGAIKCGKNLEIDNCIFAKNYADDYGGAVYADTITLTTAPSYFFMNSVDDNQGGAIYTNKFETDVKYAVFINNTVRGNDDGGAIYINDENHVTFSNCYFENNRCGDEGGAIYLDSKYSHLTLKDNSFINNIAGDEGQTVFNKGYYGKISDNYWGNKNPSSDNDQLVEWKQWTTNINHADDNPLNSYPNQTITSKVNNISHDKIDSKGIARLNVSVPNQCLLIVYLKEYSLLIRLLVTISLSPSMVTPLENRTITHIYKNVSLNNIEWLLKPLKASNIPEYIPLNQKNH